MRQGAIRNLTALVAIAIVVAPGCAIRRSEKAIRADLLERAPLGSDMATVRSLIREEGMEGRL